MHRLWTYLICLFFAITATFAIAVDEDQVNNIWAGHGDQQPMLDQDDITMIQHVTATRTSFVTRTRTRTRFVSDGATHIPKPVQTWYGAQKAHGCDKTACASCRFWYKCEGGEEPCFQCDTAPYCECG